MRFHSHGAISKAMERAVQQQAGCAAVPQMRLEIETAKNPGPPQKLDGIHRRRAAELRLLLLR